MRLVQSLLVFTLLTCLWGESHQMGYFTVGPYDIAVEQMSVCENQGTNLAKFNISMYLGKSDGTTKRKRLHRGSFSFPFTEEETDRMEVQADCYMKRSNNFLLMNKVRDSFCHMAFLASAGYQAIREAVGLPPGGCYIPKGNYTFEDLDMPLRLPTPMLEYGTYRGIINVLFDKKVIACFQVLIDVTPKKWNI